MSSLLTIQETASLTGLTRNACYELASSGELPGAVKLGGRWRVKRDVLERWLASDETEGTP